MPLPTRDWNAAYEADPPGSQERRFGDDRIRETRVDASERGHPEHHWDRITSEAWAGEHRMGSARICVGTAAERATVQIVARTADILPGTVGHEGGITDIVKINNPKGLYFYETDTGNIYYHDGTNWTLFELKGRSTTAWASFGTDTHNLAQDATPVIYGAASLAQTFNQRWLTPFRVTSPTTTGLRVNVRRGLYVDSDGTVREYAGAIDFLLAAAPGVGNDRIDLLYLNGGTLTELQGTAGASPRAFPANAPAIPTGAFPLAYIYRRASDTAFNEIDAGGATAYLLRDVRGVVTKPIRNTIGSTVGGGASVALTGAEVVRLTRNITVGVGTRALLIHYLATYDLNNTSTNLSRAEARLYTGVPGAEVLRTRASFGPFNLPAAGSLAEIFPLSISFLDINPTAGSWDVEIRDLLIITQGAGGSGNYRGDLQAGAIIVEEIS